MEYRRLGTAANTSMRRKETAIRWVYAPMERVLLHVEIEFLFSSFRFARDLALALVGASAVGELPCSFLMKFRLLISHHRCRHLRVHRNLLAILVVVRVCHPRDSPRLDFVARRESLPAPSFLEVDLTCRVPFRIAWVWSSGDGILLSLSPFCLTWLRVAGRCVRACARETAVCAD